ncbi:peptidase family S49-domain-containing protein [Cladochytrium replicatum]|nr:peptidase family S49-domain-containing protein [Cladochytrium replicatum]
MSTSRLKTMWQRGTKAATFARKTLTYGIIGYGSYQAYIIYRKQQDLLRIPEETILTWKLDKSYVTEARQERTGMISALSRGSAPLTLLEALRVLHHAKTDDRVTGLMMDLSISGLSSSRTGLGFAQIQELRNEIQAFAEEKRKRIGNKFRLVAYTDTFDSQLHYYLASVFDEVRMEPVGNIPLIGVGTLQLFFKNILDRVGLRVRAYSRGDYKGVNAPWTSEKWTEPIRENMERLLSSMNDQLVKGIADARSEKIQKSIASQQSDKDEVKHSAEDGTVVEEITFSGVWSKAKDALALVRSIMNYSPISSEEAKTWGLVDTLGYKRDSIEMNPEGFGLQTFPRTKLVVDPKDPTRLVQSLSFSRYKFAIMQEKQREVKQQLAQGKPKATVGLVYLTGTVRRGDTQFSSNHVVKALMEAANDPEVDSIVFRVDTGGGDPVASETIWEAVKFVQDQRRKPVIASFGNVSASGGYYATTGCSKILASPGTITGSIGVAALRPLVTEKLLSTLGVTFDEIYFSDSVKNNSIFHDLEGNALKRYQDMTDNLYEIFKKRVSEGRGKSMEWVEQVAGGRVWSGVDALKEGLIDEIGNLL